MNSAYVLLPSTHHYRPDIDGLRGIAVLLVVAFHAMPAWFPAGFIGVDIFFVISGYLITQIILGQIHAQNFSLKAFYGRRIRRILPALIVVVAATFGLGAWLLLRDEFQHLALHTVAAAVFTSNFLLWTESGYFDVAAEIKPLLHLWSLSIEEQFYILWPVLLVCAVKLRANLKLLTGIALLASFIAGLYAIQSDAVAAFYAPHARAWELLAGALLAQLSVVNQPKSSAVRANVTAICGATAIGVALVHLNSKSAFPGAWALLPVLGAAALISSQAQGSAINTALLSNRVLVWFGKISFPLYLWHWPLLAFARISENQTPPLSVRLALVGLSVVLAWATWRWLETPIRYGKTSEGAPSTSAAQHTKTVVLVILLGLLGCMGFYFMASSPQHQGKPQPQIQNVPTPQVRIDAIPNMPKTPANRGATAIAVTLPPLEKATVTPEATVKAISPPPEPKKVDNSLQNYEQRLKDNPDYITEIAAIRQTAIRAHRCHLHKFAQPFEKYALGLPQCLFLDANKRNVLIIGDSHAADLYVAYSSADSATNYLQATGAGCTPIKGMHPGPDDGCVQLYEYALRFLQTNKVDAVLLAARWPSNFADTAAEIAAIKALDVKVVVVGPAHEYKEDVHKLLARRDTSVEYTVYLNTFFDGEKLELNKKMAAFAAAQKVQYLDRIAAYCGSSMGGAGLNCAALSPDGELYASPAGHLNMAGQKYLGRRLIAGKAISKSLVE